MSKYVKGWTLLLTAVLLLSHLLAAFHSHDLKAAQLQGEHACAVCLLANHVQANDSDRVACSASLVANVTSIVVSTDIILASLVSPERSPRAPPTNSL